MAASELFDVQVRLEADDSPADAVELVTEALGEGPLAGVTGSAAVSTTDQGVTVRFEGVAAPGDSESAFHLQDVLPVVQALITAIIERLSEGGPPSSPRLVIEVQPARPHDQRELRRS
ncbi:MAG TPA: hypothetical protein VGN78_00350 [Solirubrobacteraceae bacterium]|nr:hypothetical protein [Solirubrobacteraceae bacterium]